MKQIIKLMKQIVFVLITLLVSIRPLHTLAEEQVTLVEIDTAKYFDSLRAAFRRNKAALVGAQMDLSAAELETFWRVYAAYEQELISLNNKRIATVERYLSSYENMDKQEAHSLLTQFFSNQKTRLSLIEKYASKLSRLLSPSVALRFVHVETQINLVVDTELASQLPLAQRETAPAQ
jgi:hypothetical protein